MKQLHIPIAALTLTCIALFPLTARADDEPDGLEGLDVTMIVLDDADDLDGSVNEMDGPDDVSDGDWNDEGESEDEREDESKEESEGDRTKGFEQDDYIVDEDRMAEEDDFEDGEDVDEDEFDD